MKLSKAISACKKGNPAAQRYLFDQYAEQMFTICYRYVKKREDAEECMQNGFLKFFNTIGRFRYQGEDTLFPWLRKIMVNECLMLLRKTNRFQMVSLQEGPEIAISEDAVSALSAQELYKMVLELPLGYRTVFNLHVIDGLTHQEIARQLDITPGTSKSQLSKAKSMLQIMIDKNNASYAHQKSHE